MEAEADIIRQQFAGILNGVRKADIGLKIPSLEGLVPEPLTPDNLHTHVTSDGRSMGKRTPSRFHYRPEIFLQLSGSTIFTMPGGRLRLDSGECLLMPARLPHAEEVDESTGSFANLVIWFLPPHVNIHLAGLDRQGQPKERYVESFQPPEVMRLQAMLEDMSDLAAANLPESETAIRGLFLAFMIRISHLLAGYRGQKGSDRIDQARALVARQFANPGLNVQALASQLDCSPDHLSHRFHKETGERLTSHLNAVRLAHAQRLLSNPEKTSLTMAEIAWHSGFSDPKYFTRLFRQKTGVAPSVFRRRGS